MRKTHANGHKGLLVYLSHAYLFLHFFLGGTPVLGASPFEYNEFASSY